MWGGWGGGRRTGREEGPRGMNVLIVVVLGRGGEGGTSI